MGASSWKEVDQWVKSGQGNGRLKSRPALQVCPYTLAANLHMGIYLFSSYTYGNGDYQRHTNETMTYKMQIKMQMVIPDEYKIFVAKWPIYIWLIYDKSPSGSMADMKTIFDVKWPMKPGLFNINHDNCHRFVVKRRFKIMLTTSNTDNTKRWTQGMGDVPADCSLDYSKFVKGLGVRTEWKNSTSGDVGDIKAGALYMYICPSNGVTLNVYGCFRMYFKSIGNQ